MRMADISGGMLKSVRGDQPIWCWKPDGRTDIY
jgi:hypothetical protein